MATVRAHLLVSGRVQGVNFRSAAQRQAEMRGITGWVRNIPDGRVELILEGEESEVRSMVDWCHHGPRGARVDRVEVRWDGHIGEFDGFDILGSYW